MKACFQNLCSFLKFNKDKNKDNNDNIYDDIKLGNQFISYKMNKRDERLECECVICLEDIKYNDNVILTECFHMYHEKCIRDWFKISNICPICDRKVI